jgi:hypothetical protein
MKSSLKSQPQFDGVTNYCNKSFNLVNQKGPTNLETLLRNLDKSGPMLGTRMFGKRRSKTKKMKSRRKVRKLRSKRRFGQTPFLEGKLSTSVQTEGLPLGAKSPTSIYQTFPNIFRQGSALPRPYGPRDNLRMQSLYEIHGFGRRRSKVKRCKSCGRRHRSRSRSHHLKKRRSRRKFGNSTTPGTQGWKHDAYLRNRVSTYMNQYANDGKLAMAKGWTPPSALYLRSTSSKIPNVIGMPNEPAQFTNNQLNSPVLFHFGKKRRTSRKKSRPSLTKGKKFKSTRRSRNFGPLVPTVAGPNTVGYQASIPLYHAGANTIDFATNQLFRPDIVGSVGKVQTDGLTPRAWLTQSVGIGDGLGNKYRFGSKLKKHFGLVYTPDGATYGTGHNTIMQPLPSYLKKGRLFGGSVITLNSAGQIQITRPSKN